MDKKFSGTFDRIGLLDLVQLACLANMNRDIEAETQAGGGRIIIRSGQVVDSETTLFTGEDALKDLLLLPGGRFHFKPETAEIPPRIKKTWELLLIEAVRYRGERELPASGEEGKIFSGKIEQIDLADLIQLACMAQVERHLRVDAGQGGAICFQQGGVFHAEWGGLIGVEAFREMLLSERGGFESRPLRGDETITIDYPWENLLMEAVCYRDEKMAAEGEAGGQKSLTLLQSFQRMRVAEKIRLAMTADKEARSLLMRDNNRMVQLALIGNPRLSDGEVVLIAGSRYIDEEVLRKIAVNREWIKLYQVRLALAGNPRCPIPIASRMLKTLAPIDLKIIAASRSVPSAVAQLARKMIAR